MTQPVGVIECLTNASLIPKEIAQMQEAPMIREMLSALASLNAETRLPELIKLRQLIDIILFSLPPAVGPTGRKINPILARCSAAVGLVCMEARAIVIKQLTRHQYPVAS